MRSRLAFLLTVVAALFATAPAQAAEIGLNVNGGPAAVDNLPELGPDLATLKPKWARHFLHWDKVDENGFGAYDALIAEEEKQGVKTLITVSHSEGQPPNPDDYAAFMARLAARFDGRVEAYQVWNEADESMFWKGGPDAGAYVATLQKSYAAIKAADPDALVVFSPTVGNNFGFVEAAYAAGAKNAFDVMAVHTDTACLDQAPSSYYREPDGRIGRFAFLGYREVYKVMQANGDGGKPIWMTEFGWSAATHTCEFGAGNGIKPAGVGEELQARYLLEAMNCLEKDPYVTVAMWFNDRDTAGDQKMENMYGLRRYREATGAGGGTRPAYDAFQTWGAGGGRTGAPCGDFEGPAVQVLQPAPGFELPATTNLTIRAQSDAPDLHRIWFQVAGPGAEPLFAGGPISLPGEGPLREREWGGARDLGTGQHRLVVWATDASGNAGPPVEIPFAKGQPFIEPSNVGGSAGTTAVRFPKLALKGRGRRRTFSGGALPGIRKGAIRVEWQLRRGRRWKRLHAKTVLARRPFKVTQTLRFAGLWRVRALYLGRPGIKRTASCWLVFHTRSARTRLSCPPNAVRPTG